MKERFPIYIDIPAAHSIAENHYRNFEFIFSNRAKIYLDLTESEIDEMEEILGNTITNPLADYFKLIDVTPFSGKDQIKKFYSLSGKMSKEFNGCIFILDVNRKEAKSISEDSGVWVVSIEEIENDPDVDSLILERIYMDNEDVKPQEQYEDNFGNGWAGLFNDRIELFPPFNEIIVYDNFLSEFLPEYKKIPPYHQKKVKGKSLYYTYIGLENLLFLFDAILPKKHVGFLRALIVLPKKTNKNYERYMEDRINVWIDELKTLRNYNICVSFLLIGNSKWKENEKESHPLHPRVLYTNYFFIGTDKGFKIFEPYPYSTIVRKDGESKNSVSVSSYLFAPKQLSNPIKANYNNKLKDIGEQLIVSSAEKMGAFENTLIGDVATIDSFSLFEDIKLTNEFL